MSNQAALKIAVELQSSIPEGTYYELVDLAMEYAGQLYKLRILSWRTTKEILAVLKKYPTEDLGALLHHYRWYGAFPGEETEEEG